MGRGLKFCLRLRGDLLLPSSVQGWRKESLGFASKLPRWRAARVACKKSWPRSVTKPIPKFAHSASVSMGAVYLSCCRLLNEPLFSERARRISRVMRAQALGTAVRVRLTFRFAMLCVQADAVLEKLGPQMLAPEGSHLGAGASARRQDFVTSGRFAPPMPCQPSRAQCPNRARSAPLSSSRLWQRHRASTGPQHRLNSVFSDQSVFFS